MNKKEWALKMLAGLDIDDEKANMMYTGKHYSEGWGDCYKLIKKSIENMK